jgi:hypothetical protein
VKQSLEMTHSGLGVLGELLFAVRASSEGSDEEAPRGFCPLAWSMLFFGLGA